MILQMNRPYLLAKKASEKNPGWDFWGMLLENDKKTVMGIVYLPDSLSPEETVEGLLYGITYYSAGKELLSDARDLDLYIYEGDQNCCETFSHECEGIAIHVADISDFKGSTEDWMRVSMLTTQIPKIFPDGERPQNVYKYKKE